MRNPMTFDDAFPDAKFGFRAPSGYVKGKLPHHCSECERPTVWFYPGQKRYFCSQDCHAASLAKYRSRPIGSFPTCVKS